MGDRRFEPHYSRVSEADDPKREIQDMTDTAVVEALAAASKANDPYLANVLATEATNRMQQARSQVNNTAEGLCSLDADGRILSANPAAEELLGRSQGELRGQDFDTLCRDGNVTGVRSAHGAYLEALRGGLVVECDTERFYRRDGTAFDVFYTAAPVIRNERIEGVIIAFHDISTRKLAAEKLRDSEARYRSLFENSPDFMFSTDLTGRVTAVSASAARIIGFEREEICGAAFDRLVASEDADAARELLAGARAGKAERGRISLVRKDQGKIQTSMLAMPIILDGEIVGIYGLAEKRGDVA
jgi:PAS domain S-box-containing protein